MIFCRNETALVAVHSSNSLTATGTARIFDVGRILRESMNCTLYIIPSTSSQMSRFARIGVLAGGTRAAGPRGRVRVT
jgi:hypothetical protein